MSDRYEQRVNGNARPRCLRLHRDDNVAVALSDVRPGAADVIGMGEGSRCDASDAIPQGHKLALTTIEAGAAVLKYGVAIGFATQTIARGAWVHTHNCRSALDERSHTLDRHTGAPTDTTYE